MIGILIELLFSWLLLKYIQQRSLNALGLLPTVRRGAQFLFGLIWTLAFVCVLQLLVSKLVANPYRLNPLYTHAALLDSLAYVLRAVLYEELLFRGAVLYILVKRIGANKAMLASAAAFGIYHWFSFGVLGSPVQMTIVLLTTGTMGYVLAMGFCRTGSMWLSIGLHLGNNLAQMVIFSNDERIGSQLLLRSFQTDPVIPAAWISLPVLALHFAGLVAITFLLLKYRWPRKLYVNSNLD